MKKMYLVLVAITLLAAVLRFYKLGEIPKGFHRDEAFLGYNAYSILKTGKDMSGTLFPLHLQSFLYSPAGYSYITIPFVSLFGLNEFSVRFASALFGTLSVVMIYLLVKQVFPNLSSNIPLLSSFFVAVSPWHINLSRTATENIVSTFLVLAGVYFMFLWHRKHHISLFVLGSACLWLTLFFYQAPRVFVPLMYLLLITIFLSQKKSLQQQVLLLLAFIIILITVTVIFLSPTNALRFKTVSIFASDQTQLVIDEQQREDGVSRVGPRISRFFHNKVAGYASTFAENYFSHWTYSFLFTDRGLPDRYRVPGSGLLYLFELPLLLFGSIYLLGKNRKLAFFLLGWVILGPVGSSTAFDDIPNLQRTVFTYPALAMISALGIYHIYIHIKRTRYVSLFVLFGLFVAGSSLFFYLHNYYIHQLVHRPWYRQEGYKELVDKINALKPSYKKIMVTNHESSPGIFFLFYNTIDPVYFHAVISGKNLHDFDRVNFDTYEFPKDSCPLRTQIDEQSGKQVLTGEPKILYVNFSTCGIPENGVKRIGEILRADESAVFKLVAKE